MVCFVFRCYMDGFGCEHCRGSIWVLIGLFLFASHALFIAHIKGNGVKLSETQLPDIYRKVVDASQKLGLRTIPDAYVMQAGGVLNAFATKFVSRNFIVIYSDLVEACDEQSREADMIIGHEIGHLALASRTARPSSKATTSTV